ncbi:MAG: oxidoreductase [Akkermansiaceae bacterium]|nr:oxidoreductase [Akkermansiaceae bacterium]
MSTSHSQKLAGKVAIVSGASKGIGAGIAELYGAEGASVVVNYASSKEGADKVVAAITAAGGKAIAVQGDFSKKADIDRVFDEAAKAYGTVDILVNNAGIYKFGALEDISEDHFYSQFNLNVLGLLFAAQRAAAQFDKEKGGVIVNISSVVATLTPPGAAVYSATKAAVDAITGSLSKELGGRKIRVNSLNPGMVETEGVHAAGFLGSDFHTQALATTPLGRIGQPDDIAKVAVFLASDESGWVTGSSLNVAGGY